MAKWSDALKVLGQIAPSIGAAAAGPLGATAVTAIESVFGLHATGDLPARQDAVSAAISGAAPETLLALKKADQDFQAHMAELGFADTEALTKLGADDRDSARKREIAVRDATPKMLAIGVTVGFFGLLFYVAAWSVPATSKDLLNIMLGSLGTAWVSIVTYYFGSSSGSARKSELLAQAPPVIGN